MNHASAKIIASSTANDTVVASAARISTTQGTSLEIYAKSCEKENNAALIEKVVGSGHTSTLEHQLFTVAFDNVSVCTEEFVIEFRLGSYTVKSRRYVDFTDAGFYTPADLPEKLLPAYTAHMQSLFDAYAKLLALDIPKEDARYLLPYCFRSNFYCTMNARELMYMVQVMINGRGAVFPELKALGESLRGQLCQYFPNIQDILAKRMPLSEPRFALPELPMPDEPEIRKAQSQLRSVTADAAEILREAAAFNGGILPGNPPSLPALIRGVRPRELEMLRAQFTICDLSLAAITHLVRHRIQSVLVPQVTQAALRQHYVMPESILVNEEACRIYQDAFSANAAMLRRMMQNGLPAEAVQYFALAGNQLDVRCDMNGRELLHFMKLRTCSRAQWEIRACAVDLLCQLRAESPEVFGLFGPSCFVTGKCPEGRLSCGKAAEMQQTFSAQPVSGLKQQMNLKLSFFENQLAEAVGGGVYMLSVRRTDGKTAPLYIGESYSMFKRCAEHLYELQKAPEYFGFTAETISDSDITLIAEIVEREEDKTLRKQKQFALIQKTNPLPLSQSGISDRQKEIPEKIAALNAFLQS